MAHCLKFAHLRPTFPAASSRWRGGYFTRRPLTFGSWGYGHFVGAVLTLLAMRSPLRAAETDAQQLLVVEPNSTRVSLLGHLFMLCDAQGGLELKDVAYGPERLQFRAAPPVISLGYTEAACWFRATIDNRMPSPSELYIWLRQNFIDHIDVYYPRSAHPRRAEDFEKISLGDHAELQPNTGHAPFQFAVLHPPAGTSFDLYIRVQTTSSLGLEAWLGSSSAFANTAAASSFVLGFVFAFLLTVACIIFLAWTRSKNPLMLWFSLFVFAFSTNIVPMSGFGLNALRALHPSLPDQFCQFALLSSHFFGLGYLARQTQLKSCCPPLSAANTFAMGYIALGFGASLLGYYNKYIGSELVIGSIMLAIFAYKNIRLAVRAQSGARVAAIGCSLYSCFGIPYNAALLGIFAPSGDLIGFLAFGNLLFVALMAISLLQQASRMEYLRREHELLSVTRRAESEAMDLVAARTAQLSAAKEAAERALEQERAAQAEQLRFVDVVTHQYRTPLAVIRTCVTAIRYSIGGGDDANRRRIGQIDTAVQRLVEIMDISLHRSRVEGYAGKANRQQVPIIPAFTRLLERCRDLHPEHPIETRFPDIAPAEEAAIDTDMVAIALANLIDNAAKFSDRDAAIEVTVSRDASGIHIEVSDEGIGIPEAEIENVGQRYFRASNSGRIFGTGLGLNIVQQVASAHGGHLRIANRVTRGTTALLTLSLAQ